MKNQATPRPWTWSGPTAREIARGEYRAYIHQIVGCGNVPPEKFYISIQSTGNKERDQSDAELICRAVNAHDALVAALKAANDYIGAGYQPPDLVDQIYAALKLAEGEAANA